MTTPGPLNIDFDLGSIFPQCIKEYNDVKTEIRNPTWNEFNVVCNTISRVLLKPLKKGGYSFLNTCIYLSNYLKLIKEKNKDRIPYCQYFYFKLKDEINYLEHSCKDEVDCYPEMIKVDDATGRNYKVLNICINYISYLNQSTFSLFQKLEALYYKNTGNLLNDNECCPHKSKCFQYYNEFCEICKKGNNERLRIFLEKYKEVHLKNVNDAPSCFEPPKFIHSTSGKGMRTVLLTSFIITLAIPFIVFILYEYTPCGLYLQPSIRKFKDIWNKKRKEEQQLINSFENTYDEFVDKCSQISYSAIDCN